MWQWVPRGNMQHISDIPQTEQHSPFGLMLLRQKSIHPSGSCCSVWGMSLVCVSVTCVYILLWVNVM